MADIEKQLLDLQGLQGSDKNTSERHNATGSDVDPDSDSESKRVDAPRSAESVIPRGGPQTGVKGVLADYRQSLRSQQETTTIEGAPTQPPTQPSNKKQPEKSNDSSSDSDYSVDDGQLYEDYKSMRIAEMNLSAAKVGLGSLRNATPEEFVDIVDQHASSDIWIVVLLLNNTNVSKRLGRFVLSKTARYPHTIFLRLQAQACGFVDKAVVPIILIYRRGEIIHNLVRVVDHFTDPLNFELQDVVKLLDNKLLK
ncbi:hypothetical protein COEREDRAFT_81544 [Coemansia reversa NRRL 1564]|uniref:Phosducin domain-containing protein n=1 Tax=Coemansia reversa (strain ATCC 12441 / NRRL 1564) TaxID=763665 RepID=A0A2G5BAR1_COERN|nr:hypothetical protein COEREDRAFT_81544 [Coemansia reversa NRRL 1564]|eukprot:PIA16105.1 hypothetical protein COEREDRAFT_81544 [Coemansia reversa NRRL 1564]